jgi:hypothetical protein
VSFLFLRLTKEEERFKSESRGTINPKIKWERNMQLIIDKETFKGMVVFFSSFLGWGETELTWSVGHCLAYSTSPGL